MTMEDFFTLTEMKGGLMSASRVKELVNVMQKEKEYVVKNASDATRQWSTVASSIAATEDKDCLDLFVQLDGHCFFDKWLKDAQKFVVDVSDNFVEDSIIAMLRAIENLRIGHEKSVSSGIQLTVKSLFGHKSATVQDKARTLFDKWVQEADSSAVPHDATYGNDSNAAADVNSAHSDSFPRGTSLFERSSNEKRDVDLAQDELITSKSTDDQKHDTIDGVLNSNFDGALDPAINKCGPEPVGSSILSNCVNDDKHVGPASRQYPSKDTSLLQSCPSLLLKHGSVEGQGDISHLSESADDLKLLVRTCPENSVSTRTDDIPVSSGADEANAPKPATKTGLQGNSEAKCGNSGLGSPFRDDMGITMSKVDMDEMRSPHHCKSSSGCRISAQINEEDTESFQDKESKDQGACSFGVEKIDVDEVKESVSNEDLGNLVNDSSFYRQLRNSRSRDWADKRSDIDLDYGIVDPLEVARQVAIEVEREVRSEPSCSSSGKISDGIQQPDSPESIDGKQGQPSDSSPKESPTGSDLSIRASSAEKDTVNSSGNVDVEQINSSQNMESCNVTEAAQEPEGHVDKGNCGFDLNQDFYSEEPDCTVNPLSSSISVVSASRAVAAPGLPVAPLQFEGSLGWKGSAATSAFRPASPRRFPEADRAVTCEGNNCSSKPNSSLDIDLNMAENDGDKVGDKQISASFGLSCGEPSVGANRMKSERLNLDLNCVTDEGDVPSDWMVERLPVQHGSHCRNLSPSFPSSSTLLQSSLRNIDLNDQPTFVNDSMDLPDFSKSFPNLSASGQSKSDESVVTIMGMKVEVNRKGSTPATSLPNGRTPDPMMDINFGRPGVVMGIGSSMPYTHSPIYDYNGMTPAPTVPFQPLYGPGGFFRYMVDSRGAPVVPQLVGSSSAIPHPFSRPPFMVTGLPNSNGAGPSQHNVDLNPGLYIDEGGRNAGNFRQFFNPGPSIPTGEQLANAAQTSSSIVGGKRKEPESARDSFQLSYKHHQPPWK